MRLGVTERAARRYVGILREAGIPVEASRGPYGGYRLGRGTRLPPVAFTDRRHSPWSWRCWALPESVGRQAASLRDHATAAPDQYSARPDPAVTSALVAAIGAGRCVLTSYRSESGREWHGEVDPWAVVARYGRWYLLCRSHRADAVRTYRVDRTAMDELVARLARSLGKES